MHFIRYEDRKCVIVKETFVLENSLYALLSGSLALHLNSELSSAAFSNHGPLYNQQIPILSKTCAKECPQVTKYPHCQQARATRCQIILTLSNSTICFLVRARPFYEKSISNPFFAFQKGEMFHILALAEIA